MATVYFNAGNFGAPLCMVDPTDEQVEALITLGCAPYSKVSGNPDA